MVEVLPFSVGLQFHWPLFLKVSSLKAFFQCEYFKFLINNYIFKGTINAVAWEANGMI